MLDKESGHEPTRVALMHIMAAFVNGVMREGQGALTWVSRERCCLNFCATGFDQG